MVPFWLYLTPTDGRRNEFRECFQVSVFPVDFFLRLSVRIINQDGDIGGPTFHPYKKDQ